MIDYRELEQMANAVRANYHYRLYLDSLNEDGGKGSGNWGHAGRAGAKEGEGELGGSVKGTGGNQNRILTKSGGFTSATKLQEEAKKAASEGSSETSILRNLAQKVGTKTAKQILSGETPTSAGITRTTAKTTEKTTTRVPEDNEEVTVRTLTPEESAQMEKERAKAVSSASTGNQIRDLAKKVGSTKVARQILAGETPTNIKGAQGQEEPDQELSGGERAELKEKTADKISRETTHKNGLKSEDFSWLKKKRAQQQAAKEAETTATREAALKNEKNISDLPEEKRTGQVQKNCTEISDAIGIKNSELAFSRKAVFAKEPGAYGERSEVKATSKISTMAMGRHIEQKLTEAGLTVKVPSGKGGNTSNPDMVSMVVLGKDGYKSTVLISGPVGTDAKGNYRYKIQYGAEEYLNWDA